MRHANLDPSANAARRAGGDARVPTARPSRPLPAAPRPRTRAARDWPLWIVVGIGSAALVAAGYLGALVQLGGMEASTVSPVHVTRDNPQPAPEPRAEATSGAVTASPAAVPEVAPVESNAQPAPADTPADTKASRTRTRDDIAKAAARATAELERELYEQPRAVPSEGRSDPTAAQQPSREAVQQVLLAMRPQIEACAAGQHGTVDASVTIAGNGRVTYSLIRGDFAGTEQGSCMARALRAATFPTFAGRRITVQFPFAL